MIDPKAFFDTLSAQGISFFTGVPDSLLKNICAYITDHSSNHLIAANEGNAVALAAGHYLASGSPSLVYMQNSGMGNAVNPLLSLADPEVYGIPMVLMIGWRGEPGVKDEPQHKKQGVVTQKLLEAMDIPTVVLSGDDTDWNSSLENIIALAKSEGRPTAVLIKANTFAAYSLKTKPTSIYSMKREEAIGIIVDSLKGWKMVATTGFASRELFEMRKAKGQGHGSDFLTVGSMGHSLQIALGLGLTDSSLKVCCLDGDGAALMQMGGMAIAGQSGLKSFLHVVLNNGCHDSVGGQPTIGFTTDFSTIARGCGYKNVFSVDSAQLLNSGLETIKGLTGTCFLEVKIASGARPDLGRPTSTPAENKTAFIDALRS